MSEPPDSGTSDRFPTRSRAVAEVLRREILIGAIPAGTHLRQAAVAEQLGVSTTPVREAFGALRREGLVQADSHKGVVVFRPTVEDLVENYLMRIALESLATRQAVPRLDAAALADLDFLIDEMRAATPREYIELNRRFHRRIYAAAGMPQLAEYIETLRDAAVAYLIMLAGEQMTLDDQRAHREHVAILKACRQGDAELAASRMGAHLEHMLSRIRRALTGRTHRRATN